MADEGQRKKPQYGLVNFERRRSPRFSVDLPIEYSLLESPEKNRGLVENASEGGLMLFLGQQLEVGQGLRIRIFFHSDPLLHSIEVAAKVVWTELPFGKEGDHRCGVRFTDIPSDDLAKLKSFLDHLSVIQAPRRILPVPQDDPHS
jgi:c-di-GMP-binding flagellar brake protein YcgR